MKVSGRHGAFWGGLWEMLGGPGGFFLIPGVGPLAAAGFIVEAIAGGAALVRAGVMAEAAGLSQLAVAFQRAGIPREKIQPLHNAIEDDKYVLMLRSADSEIAQWREVLRSGNPSDIYDLPYSRPIDEDLRFPTTTV